jgi:type II secretory ATPase GspE/PulE/Tfp pilus assembly ATPase PilB-like protein
MSSGQSTVTIAPSAAWANWSKRSKPSKDSRKKVVETNDNEVVADDAPVVQVVDRILTQAMRDRASDVHIEASEDCVRVRFQY